MENKEELKSVIQERILNAVRKSLQWDSGEITGIDLHQLEQKVKGILELFKFSEPKPSEQNPTTTISKSDGTGEIEIFQEVKDLAIAWIENYIPHNSIVPEIGQKWKLAEDIQRIVNQSMKQERERAIHECIEIAWEENSIPVARKLEKLKK